MESIKGNRTKRSTGSNPGRTPVATNSEQILQSATNLSYWIGYMNSGIKTHERDPAETFEHVLAISDKRPSSKPAPENAVFHFAKTLHCYARDRKRRNKTHIQKTDASIKNASHRRDSFSRYSRRAMKRSKATWNLTLTSLPSICRQRWPSRKC